MAFHVAVAAVGVAVVELHGSSNLQVHLPLLMLITWIREITATTHKIFLRETHVMSSKIQAGIESGYEMLAQVSR